jgi:sporulation protein YlmC with PRC-barrel domain
MNQMPGKSSFWVAGRAIQTKAKIMLQSIKQLHGNKLGASDGDIGHVKDFYFDDQSWAVRYLVADTGSWLPGRQVLLSPHAIGSLHHDAKVLKVKLTRKKIEDSPAIESHKPVSRQHEEEYHRYYGWPAYWLGDGMWGMGGGSILETPARTVPGGSTFANVPQSKSADAHLRSTQAVSGYHVQATDGIVGHICDFMMDDKSWAISQLVVKIGHRFTGNEVLVPTGSVDRISYDDSTVFVKLTKKDVEKSPAYHLAPLGAANLESIVL